MAEDAPRKNDFEQAYAGIPPWDVGKPQPAFVDAADQITGSILDAGCGTGENALFFAQRGHAVTGIDFIEWPIAEAKRKAEERGIQADFLVMDALHLEDLPRTFDSVIDCGLFHVFADEDRARYVAGLAGVVKPGGKVFLLCFSDREPPGAGPRRVTQQELRDAFAEGWTVESIQDTHFEARPDLPDDFQFSEGGPRAWFGIIRRAE